MTEKPTIEQTAWVIEKLVEHLRDGGSFRKLIYDRMGYGPESYQPLFLAGGVALSNLFFEVQEREKEREGSEKKETDSDRSASGRSQLTCSCSD